MRVFLDTNVVLDLLMKREPFVFEAERIYRLAGIREIEASVSALTIVNAHYVLAKTIGKDMARRSIRVVVTDLRVHDLTWAQVLAELSGEDFADFEDGVQHQCAVSSNAKVIVTRDLADYTMSTIPVMTPAKFLSFYAAGGRFSSEEDAGEE